MAIHEGSASVSGDATTSAASRIMARGGAASSGQAAASASSVLTQSGNASVSGDATTSAVGKLFARGGADASGQATISAASVLRERSGVAISGQAMASASSGIRRRASESLIGDATVSAVGGLTFFVDASDAWILASSATSDLAAPGALPGRSRSFYMGADNLVPLETVVVGMIGDALVSNKLLVTSASSLAIDSGYSGVTYVFNGPADIASVPKKLGFKKGDKLKLTGPVGSEPNHGRELTFEDPTSLSVMDTLTTPDATLYEFTVFRRNP